MDSRLENVKPGENKKYQSELFPRMPRVGELNVDEAMLKAIYKDFAYKEIQSHVQEGVGLVQIWADLERTIAAKSEEAMSQSVEASADPYINYLQMAKKAATLVTMEQYGVSSMNADPQHAAELAIASSYAEAELAKDGAEAFFMNYNATGAGDSMQAKPEMKTNASVLSGLNPKATAFRPWTSVQESPFTKVPKRDNLHGLSFEERCAKIGVRLFKQSED
ncbi:hypothetical protein GGR54DRAFT_638686 [Hypoxylon sp. NC1633]|nr:hypothetical protein GGR54DRAFT_638686 [Hypoxylon sp. NC1633]